jgi:hypothetical protein
MWRDFSSPSTGGRFAEAPSSSPKSVSTTKGTIRIPGSAYMDGRDLEAQQPATIMSINIWDSPDRLKTVCKIAHGDSVDVTEARYDNSEQRYLFRVIKGTCSGWVVQGFVGDTKQAPVGDRL